MTNVTTLNLASIVSHHARLAPQNDAIVFGDTRLSYAQLEAMSNKVANALNAMGIGHGDKVALNCPNLPYFPIVYYGILKAGAVVVPICVLFTPREIEHQLKDSDAKAVFVFEGTEELPMGKNTKQAFDQVNACEHLIVMTKDPAAPSPIEGHPTLGQMIFPQPDTFQTYPTAPYDTCAILYTSGTTGQPKGAELSHFNIFMNAAEVWALHFPSVDFTQKEQQTCLITLPLFHTTGQTAQMNAQIYAGNRIVLLPRFEVPPVLETFKKEKVNFWTGVPTMYWSILKYVEENNIDTAPYAENLKVLSSGGAPMPVEVMKQFEERFDVRILEGYGLSETSPVATFNHPQVPSRAGTVGQALFGVEVRCVDENDNEVPRGERGEVVIRGHNIMKGYYKRPEATEEAFKNGWFHTGDIGTMDDDGFLSIVDRKKDMILRGGYNVYPRELEEVIMTHPAVSLVAVIGVPDEKMGEEVKAYLVLKEGRQLSDADFIDWCKTQFAANKYPRYVEFRDSLPIGNTGKISKLALRRELEGK
ncbi:long-chain-fatty-acid--CoA ligase [Leptolyngbya sp. 7M]|uniref:long-chain-fatty-acid--CoA ligase n=1 Tax=Leptolyngbya sp. 7M TaxID=2812896 RepID=UPI001B8CE0CF|nr:long-chain fatty acid--CoA ligase [Leptolyngbya sp. 7M]QYO66248.1 long-chain fatty acid--CoA ligase [Leptolyngbya sp. 7M]